MYIPVAFVLTDKGPSDVVSREYKCQQKTREGEQRREKKESRGQSSLGFRLPCGVQESKSDTGGRLTGSLVGAPALTPRLCCIFEVERKGKREREREEETEIERDTTIMSSSRGREIPRWAEAAVVSTPRTGS